MKSAITAILASLSLLGLAGCESSAEPSASRLIGYQVDAQRDRSWWLTRDGVVLHGAAGALAIGPGGEAVITSNAVPILWRIDPQTLAVTSRELELDADRGMDFGFAAIVYSPEQAAYVGYSEQRSVWTVDPQLKRATKLANADLGRAGPQRAMSRPPVPRLPFRWPGSPSTTRRLS